LPQLLKHPHTRPKFFEEVARIQRSGGVALLRRLFPHARIAQHIAQREMGIASLRTLLHEIRRGIIGPDQASLSTSPLRIPILLLNLSVVYRSFVVRRSPELRKDRLRALPRKAKR
jgi:hypothetical protein